MDNPGSAMTGITLQSPGNASFPMTTYLPPSTGQQSNVSKSVSGVQSLSVQAVPGGAFATIFTPGATFPNGTYQLGQGTQQPLTQVISSQIFCSVLTLCNPLCRLLFLLSN